MHACVVGSAFVKVIAEAARTRPNGNSPVTGVNRRGRALDAATGVDRQDRELNERLYRAVRDKVESLI